MCLLTYLAPDTQPIIEHLVTGAIHNSDGHGYAIVTGDERLIIGRYMKADEAIEAFAADRARHPEGPAMFHSRFATHGEETLDNVHPFPVSGDLRTVVAHNGILPATMQPSKGDSRSDTALLALRMGQRFGSLRHAGTRKAIESWMGYGNKLVVLTTNRKHSASAYILNEHAGTWVGGIWYSNDGYLPYSSRYTYLWEEESTVVGGLGSAKSGHLSTYPWMEDLDQCEICTGLLSSGDHYLGRCSNCMACLDCLEHVTDCQCWTPSKARAEAAKVAEAPDWSQPRALTSSPYALGG